MGFSIKELQRNVVKTYSDEFDAIVVNTIATGALIGPVVGLLAHHEMGASDTEVKAYLIGAFFVVAVGDFFANIAFLTLKRSIEQLPEESVVRKIFRFIWGGPKGFVDLKTDNN